VKRVLVLECGLGFGGALTSLASFLDAVPAGSGWEFHLLSSYPQSPIREGGAVRKVGILPRRRLYGPNATFEKRLRKQLGRYAGKAAFLADFFSANAIYALRVFRYVRKHRIDIVHLNNGVLINDGGLLGAALARVPRIVHVRGPEYAGRTSALYARLPNLFLPVSGFVAETVFALGVPRKRVRIVHEGLDVPRFVRGADGEGVRRALALPAETLVVGMVGCLVPWKGHPIFLEACARVSRVRDAVFLIAGDVPDRDSDFRERLESRARALGVETGTRFLGHRPDVASVMDACDIVVHASTEPEPFGRVILEAMALGKPVVATRGGGPSEVISGQENGILVNPGNPAELGDAILRLAENPALRERMGRNGRATVENAFSISRHARTILRAYRETIEG
jgi:glycosyltransferase involved in cell wall biosynthesis